MLSPFNDSGFPNSIVAPQDFNVQYNKLLLISKDISGM